MARGSSSGGESKQGLIITLIFFILATIILGVTTTSASMARGAEEEADAAKADKEVGGQFQLARVLLEGLPHTARHAPEGCRAARPAPREVDGNSLKTDDPAKDDITKDIREKLDRDSRPRLERR
jgi:hypothetical protein